MRFIPLKLQRKNSTCDKVTSVQCRGEIHRLSCRALMNFYIFIHSTPSTVIRKLTSAITMRESPDLH